VRLFAQSRFGSAAFRDVHARATVCDDLATDGDDDLATDGPPATDEMAVFEPTLRTDPASSPGVYATASALSRSPDRPSVRFAARSRCARALPDGDPT
jgi:hypothetical protein